MNLLVKIKEYIKPAAWAQYVALMFGLIPTLRPGLVALSAAVSAGAYTFRIKDDLKSPSDPKRKVILASVGYPLMIFGAYTHRPLLHFVGGALALTNFVYDIIYP